MRNGALNSSVAWVLNTEGVIVGELKLISMQKHIKDIQLNVFYIDSLNCA